MLGKTDEVFKKGLDKTLGKADSSLQRSFNITICLKTLLILPLSIVLWRKVDFIIWRWKILLR